MEKVLNQAEIDAMVRKARGDAGGNEEAKPSVVTVWDVRQAGQIGREEVQSISTLHEGFARNLTHAVGAYLRIEFAAALVSAEYLAYGEVLQRIPEVSYLASCRLSPVGATALLQLDLAVAFPLIDVLLGGQGSSSLPGRQLTEIEEQILETVMRIICREVQSAWQVLTLEFEFEERQQPEQVQRLMPSEEKTLSLAFDITVAESRGTLNLVFPAVVSNALLRKVSAGWVRAESPGPAGFRAAFAPSPAGLLLSSGTGNEDPGCAPAGLDASFPGYAAGSETLCPAARSFASQRLRDVCSHGGTAGTDAGGSGAGAMPD